jgi:hypothetical protein
LGRCSDRFIITIELGAHNQHFTVDLKFTVKQRLSPDQFSIEHFTIDHQPEPGYQLNYHNYDPDH